ncbi:hypothetical protein AVEN_112660-1 [Araneus ventricosus]|uniref:Uncharacterized protein n=1 Tax=Araneus ventricosus TaxID=182803 RepID=A0A4Y2HV68_ARAVE|nr:hypothetical protein AVEN_112660-1 [Araneus ventricosus]
MDQHSLYGPTSVRARTITGRRDESLPPIYVITLGGRVPSYETLTTYPISWMPTLSTEQGVPVIGPTTTGKGCQIDIKRKEQILQMENGVANHADM